MNSTPADHARDLIATAANGRDPVTITAAAERIPTHQLRDVTASLASLTIDAITAAVVATATVANAAHAANVAAQQPGRPCRCSDEPPVRAPRRSRALTASGGRPLDPRTRQAIANSRAAIRRGQHPTRSTGTRAAGCC